ncbi:trehalase-domain-containing protein [Xylariaceae sp. FL1019]|nr:trehalase-domain-containing protein [Xylariaceae sp. FL1019]
MCSRSPPIRRRYSLLDLKSQNAEHASCSLCLSQEDDLRVPRPMLVVDAASTLEALKACEDTDGDHHITIDDKGPKVVTLGTLESGGYHRIQLHGNRAVSNILQELTSSLESGDKVAIIDPSILSETPLERIRRYITHKFWDGLTRRHDATVIEGAVKDTKVPGSEGRPIIYVPATAKQLLDYYHSIAAQRPDLGLKITPLPAEFTEDVYRTLFEKPGILALDTEEHTGSTSGKTETRAVPFIVPGGRFNEFFGWDSYFIGLGLLEDGRADLVKGILKNWVFEIQHYGLIPNANRSYLMLRSQPPFLTDLALRLYVKTSDDPGAKDLLRMCIQAAIKEYHKVWMASPRLDTTTGLSKYSPVGGFGIPNEVEPGHFDSLLRPLAERRGLTIQEYTEKFNTKQIEEPELEEYLRHDRGVRESGHDTSSRLNGRAANLAIMDLNFCLYKYETDIALAIEKYFDGKLDIAPEFQLDSSKTDASPRFWNDNAEKRQAAVNKYLWNEERGSYFDYDVVQKSQISETAVTCLWALWCGIASPHQAELIVKYALPQFEFRGGLASSNIAIVGNDMKRQWDYPSAWAPHQVLAWHGLTHYGFKREAARLAYRWLYTILKVFVDYNGAVCEKYDVTRVKDPHRVDAEYGNQGTVFVGYPREGFGWTNASFVFGLQFLTPGMTRALAVCAPYESVSRMDIGRELPKRQ